MDRVRFLISTLTICMIAAHAVALEKPHPEDIRKARRTGTLQSQIDRALMYGNHRAKPALVKSTFDRLAEMTGGEPITSTEPIRKAPLPDWQGMPTTGTNKMLVFLIDFPDYPHTNSYEAVSNRIFGTGYSSEFPEESLKQYYLRSSYGKLTLGGNVLGWYRMSQNRSWYTNTYGDENFANAKIIEEVANYYNASHDYSQYDNNDDGNIDYFAVIWSGPHGDWATFWWGYQWSVFSTNITMDGVRFYDFSWQWETYTYPSGVFSSETIIHETGHALGLPDYYDYDGDVGPDGGVGGLDMMDGNWGDHNSFSKFMLDWITPAIVTGALCNFNLPPSGTAGGAVMIMPGLTGTTAYAEYFMAQNRFRAANDTNYPGDGMLIWHVDARPNTWGTDFQYDNSYTEHKLLRLMEADGLEEIEQDLSADAGDYYNTGEVFTPLSYPNSANYDGLNTRVAITNISQSGTNVTADFTVVPPVSYFWLTITNPASNILVGNSVTGIVLQGAAGPQVAGVQWTNALTKMGGAALGTTNWWVASVALGAGTNVISVTGTNSAGIVSVKASDAPTNSVYGDGWATGDDGGTGFGGWSLANGANAGHFIATIGANTNMNIGLVAWGMWANSGDTASAVRPMDEPLETGGSFEVKFENNWIDGGKSAGVAWRNNSGEYLLEFMFIGGGANYQLNDSSTGRDTGLGWTDQGVTLKLTLTSSNAYSLMMNSTTVTGMLASRTDMSIRRFAAWNYSAGSGGNYDVFLSDLKVNSAPSAAMSTSRTVTVTREAPAGYALTVQSAYGSPSPPVGIHTNAYGTVLTNSAGAPVTAGTTQYVCTGWTMSGHSPAGGTATVMTMTVTNNATLTWLWQTNYYLSAAAGLNGSVTPTGGWYRAGSNAVITASPAPYYHFTNWSGDVGTGLEFGNPLTQTVDRPRSVTANFAANLTSKSTPEWWLASHGWTNDFENVSLGDQDGDTMLTWKEWYANTSPTNPLEKLSASAQAMAGVGNVIGWVPRPDRFYHIDWRTNLMMPPQILATNLVHPQSSYTDALHGAESLIYYRVGVRP